MDVPDVADLQRLVVGFDSLYGLEIESYTPEEVRAQVRIEDRHRQPAGLVHGGLLCSISESLCSLGTAVAVHEQGAIALGMSNTTNFLAPIRGDVVRACARPRRRGGTAWVWDVELTDASGRLCALTRMIVAVRPRPD